MPVPVQVRSAAPVKEEDFMKQCGIYKIENLINHKCYIGQSTNIHKRWIMHKSISNNPKSKFYDYPLYKSIRKYGIENFSFEIIELCKKEELNDLEIAYIKAYDSTKNGYNMCDGGDNAPHYTKLSTSKINAIIELLKNTQLSFKEIAIKFNVSDRTIRDINRGVYYEQQTQDYPIRNIQHHKTTKGYKSNSERNRKTKVCPSCGTFITPKAKTCTNCLHIKQRKCERPSKEELEQLIQSMPMIQIGKMFGVSDNAIRKWCKNYNILIFK